MTTSSVTLGGQMVSVSADAALEAQAKWLLGNLSTMHANGVHLKDGMRLQLGWTVLTLRMQPDGALSVFEPDFFGNPFQDEVFGVSGSLQVIERQNRFSERIHAPATPVSFRDKIVFSRGALESPAVYMERSPPNPEKGDSGWYVGKRERENGEVELEAVYAFQLLRLRPELVDVLTAPTGYMVFLDGRTVTSVLNSNNEPVAI